MQLSDLFKSEYQYQLKSINYHLIEPVTVQPSYQISCKDFVQAVPETDNSVQFIFRREVAFEPENLFSIEVSFSATLTYKEDLSEEIRNAPLSELEAAFRRPNDTYSINLVSRASLLIAQITSSYGQQPLVTPPVICANESVSAE